ncbi:unnamed protein product [Mytilus edulis]|uniref:Uncharacterized protein n=1 Tax=Mytilus edulis TaxID=6550 RepID=A0A8S3T126_MYTED|nr:unnamed protein product [Mytilus edulis]
MIVFMFMFQSLLGFTSAGTTCYYYDSFNSKMFTSYCANGCCKTNSYDPCCPYFTTPYTKYYYTNTPLAGVAGIVIGVGLVVGLSICLCCACCRSSTATNGHVITNPQPMVYYVPTSNEVSSQRNTQPCELNDNSGFILITSRIGKSKGTSQTRNTSAVPSLKNNMAVYRQH